MLLSTEDAALFFKLHRSLMHYANQRLQVVAGIASPEEFSVQPAETRLEVRTALLKRPELIRSFAEENPAGLRQDEIDIVSSWRHQVFGRFYAFRQLKSYMVFLSTDDPPIPYGVVALTDPLETLLGPSLPVMVETVLMPFKDQIVYDGIISSFSISFGGGIKRMLNDTYRRAKQRVGIVTSLPFESTSVAENQTKRTATPQKTASQKTASQKTASRKTASRKTASRKTASRKTAGSARQDVGPVLKEILGMTDEFCREYLSEEYAAGCRRLAEKLSRNGPSPLLRGQPRTWACGILRTIGWVNFLDDPASQPYLKLTEIDNALGVAHSTGQSKSAEIRKLLKIRQFDTHWTLPSRMDDNPLVWLVDVNGFTIDLRDAPRETQEVAFEKGLIPYIPADRESGTSGDDDDQAVILSFGRVYQFKVSLSDSQPVIWRRIQVHDCTLAKLHEHIQTAMGWTNSHLHQFDIDGICYGDPELLDDGFMDFTCTDSATTKVSDIVPQDGRRFHFTYEYDFGDGWSHEILFEGCPPAEPGQHYPVCVEGERACPPEDVGGVWGYGEFLAAVADPHHERHEELLEWSGPFDPDAFDPDEATQQMRQGLSACR